MNSKQNKSRRFNLLLPVIIIFCLMVVMVAYTTRVIWNVAVANIYEVGEDRITNVAARLENYLEMTKSTLWVTADTVDHMAHNGASPEDILRYITEESENQEQHFDENYTGIYGYVMGTYLDGVGWTPPEDFVPTTRDWYRSAIEAGGETTIVSPYVDAQTNAVIISISRMLSNGTDVLSLDVMMNRIQEITADLQIKEKGYGFIVNRDGMIIAHQDESQKGRFLTEDETQRSFLETVLRVQEGNFETMLDGRRSTAFVHQVLDQWYVVILVGNGDLYAEIWRQLTVNVVICTVIFLLIGFFYAFGYRNEKNYSRRIEEMRAEEQKQAYEARVLRLEKEAADQANQAKSDFLADMSHEIRTPINAVLGMNEMVLKESLQAREAVCPDPEVSREAFRNISGYALNIERAGKNLLSIINDILDFSKIEAGKFNVVEGEYRLSSVLNDVSNLIFFKAKEKGLDFVMDVDEMLPDGLYGDEVHLRQIITNLLNNAVKYTHRGEIRMDVRCAAEDRKEAGGILHLVVSVRDTGIGIKPDDLSKLFTKFQRVDLNTNSTVEGTGLGLAITQSLLELMNGTIRVESEYGAGSTFTVTLPQRIVSCEAVGSIRARSEERMLAVRYSGETFHAPLARILITDDTPMNLTVAVGLLKDTRMQIDTATGGEEALLLTEKTAYDLILMDQRMPKMDGVEALHRIRAQERGANRETPVICLTADAVIGARERYLAEGFTDYLSKPVEGQALKQVLMKYLPAEKLTAVPKSVQAPPAASAEDGYAPLRGAGIDPEDGLRYSREDASLYSLLLREFASGAEEKARELERYYRARDWKNYAILVHSLKSSSRMIGASPLSERAADLEAAADEGRESDIRASHGALQEQYAAAAAAICLLLPEPEALGQDGGAEDDILEFLPENGEED